MELLRRETRTYEDLGGVEHRVEYCLFLENGAYGVSIWDAAGYGDRAADLTTRPGRAEELFDLLHSHLVTPISLREVLEDLL